MHTDVLASLVGFPGVGQCMQRRWAAGIAFAAAFAVALVFFLMEVVGIIRSFYDFALNFDTAAPPDIRLARLFVSFAIALGVFLANVVDAAIARARIDRQRQLERSTSDATSQAMPRSHSGN